MVTVGRPVTQGLCTLSAVIALTVARPAFGQQPGVHLQHASIQGGQIEYEDRGHGEPILFIHGAMVADLLAPLASDSAFSRYRVIRLHRRGYAGSSSAGDAWSIRQDADDAAALLEHLGVSRAHIVGHSTGGIMAIELAARHPKQVQTLTILDPPLFFSQARKLQPRTGGPDSLERFLLAKGKPDFREQLDAKIPGALQQARKDERRFDVVEWQALGGWAFDDARARRVTAPVLFISQQHAPTVDTAQRWWPRMEFVELKGETHMFPFEAPDRTAEAIVGFLARHRM